MLASRDVIRMIQADGWVHVDTRGDHWHFKHPVKPGKITVPHPNKDLPFNVVKSIEKMSGLRLRPAQ